MLALSKNFCGDLYPRIIFPHAFSRLLSPPPRPVETLEVVCSCTVTLGHRITGWSWEAMRKPAPFPRCTPSPWGSMFSPPPWHKSAKRSIVSWVGLAFHGRQSLQGRETRAACPPGSLSHRSRAHSEWKHVLACGCVFSHADGSFSPVPPCTPQASGPAPSCSSHSRWEQTSH